jgi:hypothetical protein
MGGELSPRKPAPQLMNLEGCRGDYYRPSPSNRASSAMHQRHDGFTIEAIQAKLGQVLPARERLLAEVEQSLAAMIRAVAQPST